MRPKSGKRGYAFFDLCGTLVTSESNPEFIAYCVKRREISLSRYYSKRILSRIRLNKSDISELVVGHHVSKIYKLAQEYVHERIDQDILLPSLDLLKRCIESGLHVVLVTGAIQPIASSYAARLGISAVIATELNIDNSSGIIESVDTLNVGHQKADKITKIFQDIDEKISIGIGNSTSDMPMLEIVSTKYFVLMNKQGVPLITRI